jgi:hypothetical protein
MLCPVNFMAILIEALNAHKAYRIQDSCPIDAGIQSYPCTDERQQIEQQPGT